MLNRDIISNNPEKPWRWDGISYNPNITWDKFEKILRNLGIGMKLVVIRISLGI